MHHDRMCLPKVYTLSVRNAKKQSSHYVPTSSSGSFGEEAALVLLIWLLDASQLLMKDCVADL